MEGCLRRGILVTSHNDVWGQLGTILVWRSLISFVPKYVMRARDIILEGVDLRPSRMTKDAGGGVLIGGPEEFERRVKEPCKGCNGTGRDAWAAENDIDQACNGCENGYWNVWKYEYPSMRFGVMQMASSSQ